MVVQVFSVHSELRVRPMKRTSLKTIARLIDSRNSSTDSRSVPSFRSI